MNIFKCKHPFESLYVQKNAVEIEIDQDFAQVRYHFICEKCGKELTMAYTKLVGGVDAFIDRARGNA
jgi:hypothetical protein